MGGGETWDAAIPEKDMLIRPGNKLLYYGGGIRAISPRGGASLSSTILSVLNPICYWKLNEPSGTAAINYGSLGTAANGVASGITWAQMAAPGGGLAPYFDGVNNTIDVYSAALNGGINFNALTILAFSKVYNAAVWATSGVKGVIDIRDDTAPKHIAQIVKWAAGQLYPGVIEYSGTLDYVLMTGVSTADWFMSAFTVDKASDQMKVYYNGSQYGATQTGLGAVSSPVLSATGCKIGAVSLSSFWYGYLSHAVLCNYAATPAQIAAVYAAAGI